MLSGSPITAILENISEMEITTDNVPIMEDVVICDIINQKTYPDIPDTINWI
jgi:hypothetical protein